MHITTFYSFKGGVGRTQALVNVGAELAQRGRRVLLVDFDLEAPGIDTYPLPRPKDPTPGVVEFVTDYLESGEAPDASRYIYESPGVGQNGGRLWIMSAGNQDDTYARRLGEINWNQLYVERSGYLLFEDLKMQWQEVLAPDYVFIDSRTGHSDVSGICTRQLPDAVVIVFFPTDQNLRGLPKVVHDIRSEEMGPRRKKIDVLFAMANIPDLDDEDQILETRISLFAETLQYKTLAAVIHRYDSLALLNQVIFTSERPKSRLAREYRELANRLIEQNLSDRDGALAFIRRISRSSRREALSLNRGEIERRLGEIRQSHELDSEVLQHLADLRMREGRLEEAMILWNTLFDRNVRTSHVLLRRAEARAMANDHNGAIDDLQAVLHSEGAAEFEIARAVSLLSTLAPSQLQAVADAPSILHLDHDRRFWLAMQLRRDEHGQSAAREILAQIVNDPSAPSGQVADARSELAVTLLGLGQIDDVVMLLQSSPTLTTSIREAFNYAMAVWVQKGEPEASLFEVVVKLDEDNGTANYAQCLAVAFGVLRRPENAKERLDQARSRATSRPEPVFSCWRYRTVPAEVFLADLDAIGRFAAGEPIRPVIFEYVETHQ
jgi:MinD-like ATPase involved in chromosome partitioning or flagellar assembly